MMISNLPRELESEILSRVPALTLGQLQFTCKRWYALFKDPRFIKKNLKASATQMVLKKDESVYPFNIDINGINDRYDQFVQFTGKIRSLEDSEDVKISEIFHCEGLLLCKTKGGRLMVWNPCTRQTRWIRSKLSRNRNILHHKYFLGYENNKSCRSYKILSFSYYLKYQNAAFIEFKIYEFNSDSWRYLDVDTHKWFFLCDLGVSLKGNTYWLDTEEIADNFIQRFDFKTERFGRLALPSETDNKDSVSVLSVFRDEKLAVLYQSFDYDIDFKMKIWMANNAEGKDLSWRKFLVVDFNKLMINCMTRVMSFLVDEETKRVMCCDTDEDDGNRTRIYIVGEDIHKQVYREMTKDNYVQVYRVDSSLMFSYVPSLVQIPARQTNPGGKRKR